MSISLQALTDKGLINDVAEQIVYPSGEINLKKIKSLGKTTWVANIRGASADDLITAAMLADVAQDRCEPFILMIPYLPGSVACKGAPSPAWVYSNFINQLYADQVIAIDPPEPHYVDALTPLIPFPLLERAIRGIAYDGVVAPYEGGPAVDIANQLGVDLYDVEKLPSTGRYLVVVNTCAKGAKLIELAKTTELSLLTGKLDLWVTHGTFTTGSPKLRYFYDNIFTTDSHPGHSRLGVASTIVPTLTYMFQNIKPGWKP